MDRPPVEIIVVDEIGDPVKSVTRSSVAKKQRELLFGLLGCWVTAFVVAIVQPTLLYVSLPFGAIAIGCSLVFVRRRLIEFARAVRT